MISEKKTILNVLKKLLKIGELLSFCTMKSFHSIIIIIMQYSWTIWQGTCKKNLKYLEKCGISDLTYQRSNNFFRLWRKWRLKAQPSGRANILFQYDSFDSRDNPLQFRFSFAFARYTNHHLYSLSLIIYIILINAIFISKSNHWLNLRK